MPNRQYADEKARNATRKRLAVVAGLCLLGYLAFRYL